MNKNKFIDITSTLSITSIERITTLYEELEHVRINNIDGDIVECGVYKGGNILGIMEYCYTYNMDKTIWLYDTFTGMTMPQKIDKDYKNVMAIDQLDQVRCESRLEEVKENLSHSKYSKLQYIVGDVCTTLQSPNNIPKQISLLRLDTDWYESTKCELQNLFPKLSINGSLIIDDYGHWQGCKLAVDEFFSNTQYTLNPIDYTGIYLRK